MKNNNPKEEDIENIEKEYNKLKEKNLLYKLKRWEKILMENLGKFFQSLGRLKDIKKKLKCKMKSLMKI